MARYQQPLPHDLWLLATGTGLAPFCRCYKTLKLGLITRKLTWFTVFVLRLSWLMLTVFKRLLKLWEGHLGFKFIPIITRDPSAPLHERLPVLIENGELEK